jgi:hypothetical protein
MGVALVTTWAAQRASNMYGVLYCMVRGAFSQMWSLYVMSTCSGNYQQRCLHTEVSIQSQPRSVASIFLRQPGAQSRCGMQRQTDRDEERVLQPGHIRDFILHSKHLLNGEGLLARS